MAAEPVLLAVEEPKFCSLFCKVAASPLEVASVKENGKVIFFEIYIYTGLTVQTTVCMI